MTLERPLVGTSLKAYFDRSRFVEWAEEVARRAAAGDWCQDVEVFVLPDFVSIPLAVQAFRDTGIAVGAQDVSARDYGATTGDVAAARLADEGCSLAAVGHAERRAMHAEDDRVVAAKVERLCAAGLTPVLCVGEPERDLDRAIAVCESQVTSALTRWPEDRRAIVAYEPVWAIGAERSADAGYVRTVLSALRSRLGGRRLSYIYGGSAAPGLLDAIGDAADGLFLGRSAHDPTALQSVVAEARSRRPRG